MSNELEQEEAVAVQDATESTPTGSEAAETQESTRREPDFKVAMHEERTKRQNLEQNLNDPAFIYEQAKRLGLADSSDEEEAAPLVPRNQTLDVDAVVTRRIRMEKAIDKYPELTSDDEVGIMVSALINKGMDPVKAADTVYSRFSKASDEAKAEGAKAKEHQLTEKDKSRTLDGNVEISVDETQALRDRVRTGSKSDSNRAMLELMKIRNRQAKVI